MAKNKGPSKSNAKKNSVKINNKKQNKSKKKKTTTGNGITNGNKNVPKSRDPSKKADELVNFRFNNNKTSKTNLNDDGFDENYPRLVFSTQLYLKNKN
jgi:hypothetical protein